MVVAGGSLADVLLDLLGYLHFGVVLLDDLDGLDAVRATHHFHAVLVEQTPWVEYIWHSEDHQEGCILLAEARFYRAEDVESSRGEEPGDLQDQWIEQAAGWKYIPVEDGLKDNCFRCGWNNHQK